VKGGVIDIIESKWLGAPLDLNNITVVKSSSSTNSASASAASPSADASGASASAEAPAAEEQPAGEGDE